MRPLPPLFCGLWPDFSEGSICTYLSRSQPSAHTIDYSIMNDQHTFGTLKQRQHQICWFEGQFLLLEAILMFLLPGIVKNTTKLTTPLFCSWSIKSRLVNSSQVLHHFVTPIARVPFPVLYSSVTPVSVQL